MEHYVGMDVSLKETSICVVDGSGRIVSEGTAISEPSAIAAFIEAKAGSALRIGLETGPTTTWLWHELRALGLPVICIDARHAKRTVNPAGASTESLTSIPELENSLGYEQTSDRPKLTSV